MSWIPERIFRPRGWVMMAMGLLALLLAQWLGRRDLLVVAVFLLALPPLASAGLRLLAPGFSVKRRFSPAFVEAGTTASVTLEVHGTTPGGASARITEQLPAHLIDVPRFDYPSPVSPRSLLSRYSYNLHPTRRGVFTIGPLTARFGDPFDVALLTRDLDPGELLTVAPAAVVLPEISLTGGRGQDGSRMTRQQANPSDDDVMTREYRHGDPLRRVHWPATARQGKLMVRAEESVTTPEAALVLDQRMWAYGGAAKMPRRADTLASTPAFEWAVTAAVSIAVHLVERSYSLRVLDDQGRPGFQSSRSANEPDREDFSGQSGALAVAQSLAALELAVPARAEEQAPLADTLADKLIQTRRRGPVIAVTGLLTDADAMVLAAAVEAAEGAYALVVCPDPAQMSGPLNILRRAGWQALALTPNTPLLQAWVDIDAPEPLPSPSTGSLHHVPAAPRPAVGATSAAAPSPGAKP
ncbi:DUF58 domain-containing protein [Arthrobacter livingstonensis]|uniref:DUF58 domain-containing protein n=1 Tax=Arthrobacter livingstonensis TaxID=670078 RepID=A0A2V5LCW4_9MICC|nr:DUF58 domain-containing protein [Arthrobacter livingstonensis]PYI68384.1 DUF58 domain-containing protein [Arthrobacter livingstonensis]